MSRKQDSKDEIIKTLLDIDPLGQRGLTKFTLYNIKSN